METFKFVYCIEGMLTCLPQFVIVKSTNYDDAVIKAHKEIQKNPFVESGKKYEFFSKNEYDPLKINPIMAAQRGLTSEVGEILKDLVDKHNDLVTIVRDLQLEIVTKL